MKRIRAGVILVGVSGVLTLAACVGWGRSFWAWDWVSWAATRTEGWGTARSMLSVHSMGGVVILWWHSGSAEEFRGVAQVPDGLSWTRRDPTPLPGQLPGMWRAFGRGLPRGLVGGSVAPAAPYHQMMVELPWYLLLLCVASPMAWVGLRRWRRGRPKAPVVGGRWIRSTSRACLVLLVPIVGIVVLSFFTQWHGRCNYQRQEGTGRVRHRFAESIVRQGAVGICVADSLTPMPEFSEEDLKRLSQWSMSNDWMELSDGWAWKGEEGTVLHALGFGFQHRGLTSVAGVIPLWPIALVLAILPTRLYWRRRVLMRRIRLGLCLHCGYDVRAGHERCPECGRVLISRGSTQQGIC